MFGYKPPAGYEIRTTNAFETDGRFAKVTPYYLGRPIADGKYTGVYGYAGSLRAAKRAIRAHRRNGVDRKSHG